MTAWSIHYCISVAATYGEIDDCCQCLFIPFQQTLVDKTLDHLLNCTEKVLDAGGLAKFGSISSGCKLCSNRTVQLRRQKKGDSHVDGSCSDDKGKQHAPF